MDFLVTRERHPDLEQEALVQECLVHWWTQRPRYNSKREASIETFLRRVVKGKLIDLERGIKAQKRGRGRRPASLEKPISSEKSDSDTLANLLNAHSDTAQDAIHRVSLEAALSRLSPRQKQIIAGLLEEPPKSQISLRLGVPRATLYDELKRIQRIFRDEGLNQFLD